MMDDYTWERRLRQRNRRSKRIFFAIMLVLGCLAGTLIWYFGFYRRTPEYALKQIQQAVAQQDAETFAHYVNLTTLTNQAYDDLTVDLFAYDQSLTPQTRIMFEKFYVTIKPQLAGGTAETIRQRVADGRWSLPNGTDILQGRQLGIDYERFLERSQIRNTSLVRVAGVERQGETAVASLQVVEDYTQLSFTLELVMEQAQDGHWQVVYVRNYRDYLDKIAPLQNGDIASYIEATKPIVDAYNPRLKQLQAKFRTLVKSTTGHWSNLQRDAIATLLRDQVLPLLQERQDKLDDVEVPPGAQYLARQRQQSTEITRKAWQHFLRGVEEDQPREFDIAETLLKQDLAVDLRVEDIIHHTAVSKNMPNLP